MLCAAHDRVEVEDTVIATIQFDNGAIGAIEASTAAYPGSLKRLVRALWLSYAAVMIYTSGRKFMARMAAPWWRKRISVRGVLATKRQPMKYYAQTWAQKRWSSLYDCFLQ